MDVNGPDWPVALQGRHRQLVDAYEANAGNPLTFAYTVPISNKSATAVVVLRYGAFPIVLGMRCGEIQLSIEEATFRNNVGKTSPSKD